MAEKKGQKKPAPSTTKGTTPSKGGSKPAQPKKKK